MLKYKIPQIVTLTRFYVDPLLWIYFRKEMKKELSINLTPSFLPVGVTGFEPATTRPPDAYSNRAELHPELRMQKYVFILK